MMSDDFSHFIRTVRERCDASHKLAVTPCHLFAIGEVSRPRYVSCIDCVSDHYVKPLFGCCRTEAPAQWSAQGAGDTTAYSTTHIVYPESM